MEMSYRLKTLRKKRGYTQIDFARIIGVPVGTYRNWEQGINAPDNETIIRIVKALETTSDYLFGATDESDTCTLLPEICNKINHICIYLNSEGQKALLEYAKFLLSRSDYQKDDQTNSRKKAVG